MNTFGKRLKALREERDLSQEQLAQLMDKSGKSVVSSWERGSSGPNLTDLIKLCQILGTTAGYLVDGNEVKLSEPPPGYILMLASEVIELQRQVISNQAKKNEDQNP